jgi:hypothetical protein
MNRIKHLALAGLLALGACPASAHNPAPEPRDDAPDLLALRDMPPPRPRDRDGWDRIRHLEIAFQALNAADFAVTAHCLRRDICHELNPLLGRHPSTGKLLAVKIGTGAVHYLVARRLARTDPGAARVFEIVSIVVQGGVVAANARILF